MSTLLSLSENILLDILQRLAFKQRVRVESTCVALRRLLVLPVAYRDVTRLSASVCGLTEAQFVQLFVDEDAVYAMYLRLSASLRSLNVPLAENRDVSRAHTENNPQLNLNLRNLFSFISYFDCLDLIEFGSVLVLECNYSSTDTFYPDHKCKAADIRITAARSDNIELLTRVIDVSSVRSLHIGDGSSTEVAKLCPNLLTLGIESSKAFDIVDGSVPQTLTSFSCMSVRSGLHNLTNLTKLETLNLGCMSLDNDILQKILSASGGSLRQLWLWCFFDQPSVASIRCFQSLRLTGLLLDHYSVPANVLLSALSVSSSDTLEQLRFQPSQQNVLQNAKLQPFKSLRRLSLASKVQTCASLLHFIRNRCPNLPRLELQCDVLCGTDEERDEVAEVMKGAECVLDLSRVTLRLDRDDSADDEMDEDDLIVEFVEQIVR